MHKPRDWPTQQPVQELVSPNDMRLHLCREVAVVCLVRATTTTTTNTAAAATTTTTLTTSAIAIATATATPAAATPTAAVLPIFFTRVDGRLRVVFPRAVNGDTSELRQSRGWKNRGFWSDDSVLTGDSDEGERVERVGASLGGA